MSLEFGWRRFNFFDKSVVLDKENKKEKFLGLKDVNVDCWCPAGDSVFLGEAKGGVFRLTSHLEEYYWKAYQKSLASLHLAGKFLFSIGEDEEEVNSILKIWDPDTTEKNAPQLKRSVRMSPLNSTSSFPACTVAVHSSLTAIAVGYADGSVLFYQGDVLHDKSLNSRWISVRDASVIEGSVTGLAIAFVPLGKTVIFVITPKHVFSYVLENRNVVSKKRHEANGATSDCWTFNESTGQLIVASHEMVYFYDADQSIDVDGGVGRCLQLGRNQEKLQLVAAGEYLALLTKKHALIQKDAEFMTMMTVYDIKGQYIGFSCSLPNLCRLFVTGSSMLILGKDGTLSELTEKNLNTKLDILFKKNLFDVALGIAKKCRDGIDHLKSIHAKYADYLYGKGDYVNAIDQYKETIGMLEPSYVIKKYLDGAKLSQLCTYLECLHESGNDNLHHTNILLNAYARQGDKKKLMLFVNKLAEGNYKTDIGQVIQLLVDWNYYPEASLLATKFDMHHLALSIITENLNNYSMAVKYISKRPPLRALEHLEHFGRILLEKCREETIALIVDVVSKMENENFELSMLFDIFIGDTKAAEEFMDFALQYSSSLNQDKFIRIVLEIRMRMYELKSLPEEYAKEHLIPLVGKNNEEFALNLAQVFDCSPVVEHILRSTGRVHELMQYYQKKDDLGAVIKLCKSCKQEERQRMWLDALSFVSKLSSCEHDSVITEMLEEIDKQQAVHPLVVLEILSKSTVLTISTVKSYIISWLQKQEKNIEEDKKTLKENEQVMDDLDEHIESLKFNPQVLQVSKCSACDTGLQLPTVHFLCKHSYHVNCFESHSEDADECPACVNLKRIEEPDNFSERSAYPKFQMELENSTNSIELIAKYLENGLFNDRKHGQRRTDAASRAAAALVGAYQTSGNPFDDEESGLISRTMSTVSSSQATTVRRGTGKSEFKNNEGSTAGKKSSYDNSKNPFASQQPKGSNPFGDF